jgi:hypothetical protein
MMYGSYGGLSQADKAACLSWRNIAITLKKKPLQLKACNRLWVLKK